MKKYLLIFDSAPYSKSDNLEGIELALSLAAFAQQVALLFLNDGVLQLVSKQASDLISKKPFTKVFAGLDLFDIKNIYADADALRKYQLTDNLHNILECPIQELEQTAIQELITQHDIVLKI